MYATNVLVSCVARRILPTSLILVLAACGEPINLRERLKVADVSTGWFDAGIVAAGNKLVPSITFRLQNFSREEISRVQINAVFRRIGETEEWGSAYTQAVGAEPLRPGAKSQPITLRSELGYTGTEPRAQMLKNKEFRDAKVELYGKHGSTQWVLLGEFPIERQVLVK